MRIFNYIVSLLFSLSLWSLPTHAASFDCSKATTETEIAICNDDELSALDELMSEIYSVALEQFDAKPAQKKWLKFRDEPLQEDSGQTIVQSLQSHYLSRITKVIGQLNQADVITIFKNNGLWDVDETISKSGFIFSHGDFLQIVFLPSPNNATAFFVEYSNLRSSACTKVFYSFKYENLIVRGRCNSDSFGETYSYINGNWFLSEAWVSYGNLQRYDGKLLYLSGDYVTGTASGKQRICSYVASDCFLEPSDFTYSFDNRKKYLIGSFSRWDDLPHKNIPYDVLKADVKSYFERFSQDKKKFKEDFSYPEFTKSITSFIAEIETDEASDQCDYVLSGYSKTMLAYTAIFSNLGEISNSIFHDRTPEFYINQYESLAYIKKYDIEHVVALSTVLNFLKSIFATENIVSFWYHKLDKDTQRELSLFSQYALEYRSKSGKLFETCGNLYRGRSVYNDEFGWLPPSPYMRGFWNRRISDGTADQVQTIFELVASFNVSE